MIDELTIYSNIFGPFFFPLERFLFNFILGRVPNQAFMMSSILFFSDGQQNQFVPNVNVWLSTIHLVIYYYPHIYTRMIKL